MPSRQKGLIGIAVALLWASGIWIAWLNREITPGERYADWLSKRKSPASVGPIEAWATRLGIHNFASARRRSDLRETEFLMTNADYAIPVVSWIEFGGRVVPATSATWPSVERAFFEQLRKPNSSELFETLSRTDSAGFATWQRTLARSAYRSGSMNNLASIMEELRTFEQTHGSNTSRSDSLQHVSEFYAKSPADLGRSMALATDKEIILQLSAVMDDRRLSIEVAYQSLLNEWKSGEFPETEWDLPEKIVRDARLRRFRTQLLDWLALRPGSERWREKNRRLLGNFLDEIHGAEPVYAREVASHLVREITRDSAELGSDWRLVTGILLSKIDPAPDLRSWIDDDVGRSFSWLCHSVGAEGLLNRSVRTWIDDFEDKSRQIGPFISAGHFAAACALIEGSEDQSLSVVYLKRPGSGEPADTLDEFLAAADEIGEHASHPQTVGFVRFLMARLAKRQLYGSDEENAANEEILKAVKLLNRTEIPNRLLLEEVVRQITNEDREVFEVGRPCFDRWRGDLTPDEFLLGVARGDWQGEEREHYIWTRYFSEFVGVNELPSIKELVTELVRSPPDDQNAKLRIERLEEFLCSNGGRVEIEGLDLVVWMAKKMFAADQWGEASRWLFDRLDDHFANLAETDRTRVVLRIHENLGNAFGEKTVPDFIRWVGAVANEPKSSKYLWPRSFPRFFRESRPDSLKVARSLDASFRNHPHRRWIVRSLLSNHAGEIQLEKSQYANLVAPEIDMWLKDVISEHFDNTFDPQEFTQDMASASPAARRFLLENPPLGNTNISRSRQKHPTGRSLTEEEDFQLILWESEQFLEIAERKEQFHSFEMLRKLSKLVSKAENRPSEDQIQLIMQRMARISPNKTFTEAEIKELKELQSRALSLSGVTTEKKDLR